MDTLIAAAVHLVLLVVAIKVFLWARKRQKAARTKWRRRVGLTLFFLPLILWFAGLVAPEPLIPLVEAVGIVSGWIDAGLAWAIGSAQEELTGVWRLVVKPLVNAAFYTGAGWLIGWPLDKLKKPEDEE